MREWMKHTFLSVAGQIARPANGVYIMNGHFLSRSQHDAAEVFASQLARWSRWARFINIETAVDLVRSRQAAEVDETLVAFTFDDGFKDCHASLAPALEKHGVNACFFVNPGFVEGDERYRAQFTDRVVLTPGKRPMNWAQLRELHERGFIIGNHTWDHVRLSRLPAEQMSHQVLGAKQRIEEELQAPCEYFAWPFGQQADVTPEVVKQLCAMHRFVFSGCDYQHYLSHSGIVFNRRHFEADWPVAHVKYFLSKQRDYAA